MVTQTPPKPAAMALLAPILNGSNTSYASFSSSIYFQKEQTSLSPEITPNLAELESSAKQRLSPEAHSYAAGGCGLELTMRANREAFDHV